MSNYYQRHFHRQQPHNLRSVPFEDSRSHFTAHKGDFAVILVCLLAIVIAAAGGL